MYRIAVFLWLVAIISVGSCSSCATTAISTPEVIHIRSHVAYDDLSNREKALVEEIMEKALRSDRKDYYFSKLELLISTVTNHPAVTRKLTNDAMNKSVAESKRVRREIAKKNKQDLEDYLSTEELYEQREGLEWFGYRPYFNGPSFYVSHNSYDDILVHIRVRLHGDYSVIEKVILLEDAIEKHLHVPGFSVNLVFVGSPGDNVFEVSTNPSKWATSHNWSGGYKVLAHELMHLMGLPDEYDRIEMHAGNKNMTVLQRLLQFRAQMDDEIPEDARLGIMCFYAYPPLERHICAAVGLDEVCVQARNEAFHLDEE